MKALELDFFIQLWIMVKYLSLSNQKYKEIYNLFVSHKKKMYTVEHVTTISQHSI